MQTQALSDVIGLAVADFDVRTTQAPDLVWIRKALADHSVVCFKDQTLTQADLVKFSQLFGPSQLHVLTQWTSKEHAEVYLHSNIVENGKLIGNPREGYGWHSDLTYLAKPTAYTFLYGVETPPTGGNTDFLSMVTARPGGVRQPGPDAHRNRVRHRTRPALSLPHADRR